MSSGTPQGPHTISAARSWGSALPSHAALHFLPTISKISTTELEATTQAAVDALKGSPPPKAAPRPTWGSRKEYLLSVVGFSIGLGSVVRFPKLVLENGGGAFLIPYGICLLFVGLPLFILEVGAGQMFQAQPADLWSRLEPRLSGLGWASVVVSYLSAISYNVVIAWSLFYLAQSVRAPLPWADADPTVESGAAAARYWEQNATRQLPLDEPGWGELNWPMVGCLALSWAMVSACLRNGIASSGKVVLFSATFPYLVLVVLFVRGVTLDGALIGIRYFLSPDFSALRSAKVWVRAANQIFFSLGPGFGTHITYASYNPRSTPFVRDAVLIACVNVGTSVFGGCVVFAVLGHLAKVQNVGIAELALGGPGLAFVAYPTALARMPGAQLFAVLFFLMLVALGANAQIGTVEVVAESLLDVLERRLQRSEREGAAAPHSEPPPSFDHNDRAGWQFWRADGDESKPPNRVLARSRWLELKARLARSSATSRRHWLVSSLCVLGLLLGLVCTSRGGVDLCEMLDYCVTLFSLFAICVFEVGALSVYGFDRFASLVELETGEPLPRALVFVWRFVSVPACVLLLGLSLAAASDMHFLRPHSPAWVYAVGWVLAALPAAAIAAGGIAHLLGNRSPNVASVPAQTAVRGPAEI